MILDLHPFLTCFLRKSANDANVLRTIGFSETPGVVEVYSMLYTSREVSQIKKIEIRGQPSAEGDKT